MCIRDRVYINVLEPAYVSVPAPIKTVVIVNRTYVPDDKKTKTANILEGVLTQELPFQDRIAAEECVRGVVEELNSLPRFQAQFAANYKMIGAVSKTFPQQIDWAEVSKICKEYNCDGLIALEIFDSDNIHDVRPIRKEKTVDGKLKTWTEFVAHLGVRVQAGWRIYDPVNQRVVDQNIFNDSRAWDGSGSNQMLAIANCPPQIEMVKQGAYSAGAAYAQRISPKWITVTRDLYKKGNDDIKMAGRMCTAGQWHEAGEVYRKYVNDGNHKIAGRACHNLAVICEVEGNLDEAVTWVQKAYTNYGLKRSMYYFLSLIHI